MESAMKTGLSEEGKIGFYRGQSEEEGDSGLSDKQVRTDKWFKSEGRRRPPPKDHRLHSGSNLRPGQRDKRWSSCKVENRKKAEPAVLRLRMRLLAVNEVEHMLCSDSPCHLLGLAQ